MGRGKEKSTEKNRSKICRGVSLKIKRRKSKNAKKINRLSKKWKIIAIIFISLFIAETLFILWSVSLVVREEKRTMECWYEICEDHVEAVYDDKLCTCYDYDMWGDNLLVVKEEWMG